MPNMKTFESPLTVTQRIRPWCQLSWRLLKCCVRHFIVS